MKTTNIVLLLVAGVIGWTVFSSAQAGVTDAVGAGAFREAQRQADLSPIDVKDIGGVVRAVAAGFKAGAEDLIDAPKAFQVAAPAPALAYTEVINGLQSKVDALESAYETRGSDIARLEALVAENSKQIAALQARKECTCPKAVAAPVPVKAPVAMVQQCQNGVCRLVPVTQVQQPQAVYQGGCSDGSCGTRRGLFGRRR